MKKIGTVLLTAGIMLFGSCKEAKKGGEKAAEEMNSAEGTPKETEDMAQTITLAMSSHSDINVKGKVTFTEEKGEVKMTAEFTGLEKKETMLFTYTKQRIVPLTMEKSAGGHWNPTNEKHGKWGADAGYHKGDIGNFVADADGNAKVEFSTKEWCMGCADETKNIIGRAVIVHQGRDDFTSQPSGDAGARVACTAILK